MSVEVDEVIVAGMGGQLFAEIVEGGWSEDRHFRGQVFLLDQLDQRPGD